MGFAANRRANAGYIVQVRLYSLVCMMRDMPRRVGAKQPEIAGCAEMAHRLRISVGELVRAARSADRLPPVTAGVMDALRRHGPLTTAELASLRQVRHQSMATAVAELRAAGYVEASPHPVDGRKKLITLTEAGRAELAADVARREAALTDAIEQALSDDDRRALTRGLDSIDRVITLLVETAGEERGQFITGGW